MSLVPVTTNAIEKELFSCSSCMCLHSTSTTCHQSSTERHITQGVVFMVGLPFLLLLPGINWLGVFCGCQVEEEKEGTFPSPITCLKHPILSPYLGTGNIFRHKADNWVWLYHRDCARCCLYFIHSLSYSKKDQRKWVLPHSLCCIQLLY